MDTFFENKFITTKNAEDISGYTSDYLARLARLGKISAKRIGHSWFIEKESLARFMEQQETRKADHIRTLTRERAEEYLLHQDVRRDALHQDSQQEVARNSLLKRVAGNFINPVPVSPSQFFFPESPLRSQIRAALVALVVITSSALVAQVITSPSITKGTSHFINEISSAIGTTFGSVPGYVTDQAITDLGGTAVPITNTRVRDSLLLATDSGGVTVFAGNVHDVTSSVFKDLNFSSIQTSFRKVSEDAANAPTKFASRIRTTPILSPSEIAQAVRFSAAAAYSIVTTPSVIVRAIGHSYIAIGTEAYGIINKSFSGYQDIIARSGGKTFDAAITVRDLLVLMPSFITRMNLAFGNVVIDSAYFAIRTDVSLAYWVARMAPESARVTFMAIGSVGDMLARVAEGTPSLATALFLRTTAVPAVLAPEISKTVVEAGYEGATHFVRTANFIAEGYLSAILGAGRIAYAGAVGAMTASRATTSLVVSLPARMQDAYLGALGKTALAFESVDSLSHPPKQSLLAAVFPTLSIGEQAALFTYQTVRNLFTSTGEVLSGLLGSSSDVSIVSNPPSVVLPFASSTVSNIVLTQAPPSKEEVPESAAVSAQQARTRIAISPPTSSPAQPAAINNYPTYTTVVKGVSEDFLNQSLASMRTGILASVAGMIQPVAAQTAANITTIQQVNMIQDLSNLIVRNGDFRGGTFSGGSLTSGVSVSATTGSFENLTISGTGTTTSAGGLNLSSGCFAVDGTCITGGGGGGVTSLTATYPLLTTGATGGITISTAFGTTTANTFSALNIFNANASTTQLTTTGATYLATLGGNVGIGTTTPGTLLSLGNTGANTVNISATATSTFGSGINVLTGCFAVNGTCVGGGSGSGTVGSGTIGQFPYYAANGTTLTATSSLFLATSGNVGIGTTTPWAQLSVNPNGITGPAFVIGSSTATKFIVTNGGNVGIGTATPTSKLTILDGDVELNGGYNLVVGDTGGLKGAYAGTLNINANSGASTIAFGGTTLKLYNPSTAYAFDLNSGSLGYTNGNVGFGTTTPLAKLDIAGTLGSQSDLFNVSSTTATDVVSSLFRIRANGNVGIGTTTPWAQLSVNPNGITGPAFVIGSSTATNFIVTNGGNVGIGTVAPEYPLDVRNGGSFPLNVVSGSYGLLRLESTGGGSEGWLSVTLANSVAPFRIVTSNSSPITLDPGGNERVRVTSDGNVGIGTTTPGTLLSLGNTGNDTVNISATATSTFGSGLSIRTGCFAINGTCLSTGGSGTVTSIATNNGLTGGTITTSGTIGLAAIAANSVLGNITGSSGVPSAIATSSLFQNASASASGLLTSGDWSTFNNKQAALTFTYPLINTANTISTAFGTTTANTFSALNIFNANASTTQLTTTGAAYLATTGGNVGIGTTAPTQKLDVAGFINTDQYSGYKQAGNTVLYASTTNASVAVGASAAAAWMAATSTLFYGTAAGQGALSTAPTADGQDSNSAFGYNALFNTIAANNTAIGKTALYTNSTGVSNTASGVRALYSNSSGGYNTATGNAALYNSINGSNNSADGVQALYYNTASSNVSALGYAAAQGTGNYSNQGGVYVGSQSGYSAATGSDYNTFLGYQAGYSVTSGGYNIIIGQNVDAPVVTGNQQLNIGNLIYGTSVYGGSSVSSTPVNGRIGIGTTTPWAQLSVNPNGITGPAFVIGSSTATNFVVTNGGNVGIGTTTPWRKLSIEGSSDLGTNALAGSFTATSTTATTTLAGFLDVNGTGTNATSTFASNLWVKGTLKIGLASIYLTDGGIRSTDGTVNITSGATATSTVSGYFGIGTTSPYRTLSVAGSGVFTGGDVLTSTLTATSSITAASLSLTTALPVSSGGTGQTTFTSSQLLYGNGTSALSSVGTSTLATGTGLTSSGTLGYQVGGTNSTLSFASIAANSLWANPTGASAVPQVIATSSLFQNASASLSGLLTSTDWSTFNNKQAALTFTYPLINTANTISTAFGTTTANTFSALNIFNANASTTQLTSTGAAYLATTGGSVGIGTTTPWAQLSINPNGITGPAFVIGSSTATKFIVTNGGNVGIGTASPTYKFQLVGPGTGQLNAMFENDGDQAILNFNAWGSQAWHSGSFSASRGRGTKASPDYPSNGDNLFSMNMGGWQGTEMSTDNGIRISFQADGTWTSASTPGMITFSVNDGTTAWNGGAQSMVFRSTGNLGIGEASPGSKLSVSGGATIGASYSTTAAPTNGLLVQGNAGIGTTSPATLLEVGGSTANVTFDGYKNCTGFTSNANGLVACTASDQRLKQDVLSLEGVNGLVAINALNPVSFYWKPEANRSPQQQFGLIAQQVQGVFPNLVATSSPTSLTPDGTLSVNYEGLISPMVRAIQQLDARTNFMQSATTSSVLTVDVAGNIGIGTTTPNHMLTVAGDIAAIAFVNTSTRSAKNDISYVTASSSEEMLTHLMGLKVATYRYKMEGQNDPLHLGLIAEDAQTVAPEILSGDGKGVDIYKLATFTLSGVQALAAKLDAEHMRVTALEDRVAALESGAVSSATGSPISFSTTSLASALSSFGIVVQKGIAQFDTLVARQFVASKDADGTSSAGTATILTGNTVAQVNNSLVKSSTKIFVTFNSQIQGNWWVSDKTDGSFRVTLSTQQLSDVSFDYFLVQTEGQITSPASTTTSPNNAGAGLPGITLLGDNPIHISVGAVFTDPGVIITGAADAANPYTTFIDGIERTVSSTTISTESPTTYIITYKATNTAGDSSTKMRSVIVGNPDGTVSIDAVSGGSGISIVTTSTTTVSASVVETATTTATATPADVTPPVVTLTGAAAMETSEGQIFIDPGATAVDVIDGDLTTKIITTGLVDTAKAGLYTLTYSATDVAGNTGTVSRVVTVTVPITLTATASTSPM